MARKKRATGGKVNVINGEGSPILEAGKKTSAGGFKRGGATKGEEKVEGEKSEPRMDKRARGGRTSGSPYSSAGSMKPFAGKSESGHEGEAL